MYPNGINGIVASDVDAGFARWACDFWTSTADHPWGGAINPVSDINNWEGEIGDGEQYSQGIYNFVVNWNGNSENGYFADWLCDGNNCLEDIKAVELCYNFEHNGFDDWYLPHIKTLYLMYELKEQGLISNFGNSSGCYDDGSELYWSSSGDGGNGGIVRMDGGQVLQGSFGGSLRVRPVRKF